MKLSRIGRVSMALVVSVAMGLGMTACGGGTIGFMWVLGTQYNQIAGFKIDDYTGNLTTIPNSPFSSGGTNPVSIVVRPGGRYVYVVNEGGTGSAGNISEFSVGGEGILTFQQSFTSQGTTPVWASLDSTGNFLYVLDQLNPAPVGSPYYGLGDLTVFALDPNTGRLSLVLNNQVKDPLTGLQLTYFPVGQTPTMVRLAGGCLFTLDSADQTIFPDSIGTAGQLTLTTNSTINTGATRLTSINTGGSYVYLTDAGLQNSPGQILPYTVGSNCALNTLTGGPVPNLSSASNPVYAVTDSKVRWLYVLNQSTTNTNTPNSSISVFTIDPTTGKLTQLAGAGTNNPYPTGSGPVCMVEDPSNQYFYTSNNTDGTVTGKLLDNTTGELRDLTRGSTFTATGRPTCLAVSGNVD